MWQGCLPASAGRLVTVCTLAVNVLPRYGSTVVKTGAPADVSCRVLELMSGGYDEGEAPSRYDDRGPPPQRYDEERYDDRYDNRRRDAPPPRYESEDDRRRDRQDDRYDDRRDRCARRRMGPTQ